MSTQTLPVPAGTDQPSGRAPVSRQVLAAVRALVVLTVVLGLAYPLLITGIAQVAFPHSANRSLVREGGRVVGSELLGQSFSAGKTPLPQWFQPRPSAAGGGYDATASSASNLGPENQDLLALVLRRRAAAAAADGVPPSSVPADALTASASGLDPDISPDYAREQVARVATARSLPVAEVRALVEKHVQGRQFGFLGEEHVNVLALNLALQRLGG